MSEVNYFSEKFSASQTVKLMGIRELCEEKRKITFDPFSCADDPNPVYWKLEVRFGTFKDDDGNKWVSAFLYNASNRNVYAYAYSISLNKGRSGDSQALNSKTNKKFLVDAAWGLNKFIECSKFLALARNDLEIECNVKVEVTYGGKFIQRALVLPKDNVVSNEILDSDPKLNAHFSHLFETEACVDVTFEVGSVQVKASKAILSARSDFFRAMFQSGMKESQSSTVPIFDVDGVLFRHLICFLYSGVPPPNLKEIAFDLLPLADRFQVDFLFNAAADSIARNLSLENSIKAGVVAEKHSCVSLRKSVAAFLKKNIDEAKNLPNWKSIFCCPNLMSEIL